MKQKTFGQKLKALRLTAGMTQGELAQKISSTKAHVSQIENGHRGVGWELVCRIADALDVPVGKLR